MSRAAFYLLPLVFAATLWAAPSEIPLKLPSKRILTVELMITEPDRAMGLMYRDALPENRALLFVFDTVDFHPFWMKNCRFPIDIVWLDQQRKVVHLEASVPPCKRDPCPSYPPLQRAAYVLELNAGQARKEKLALGSQLEFTLPR